MAALAVALAVAGCGSTAKKGAAPPRSHIVVIVMENKSPADVTGTNEAPYLDGLRQKAAVPAAIYGITHPSLPNYLALIGGDTFGITHDCTNCHVKGRNLAVQLHKAHISWKAYMQGMPRPCYHGAFAGRYPPSHSGLADPRATSIPGTELRGSDRRYAKKHNPFMYFDNIRNNRKLCARVVPIRELRKDLKTGKLPAFIFVTPDLCNDMHDCVVRAGDQFLSRTVPELLPRLGPQGFMVITWDEGRTDRGCCGATVHGGNIPTLVLGPTVLSGAAGTAAYNHYSTLRTIEDALGLPRIGHAADPQTHPLDSLFSTPPRIVRRGA
jgi:hypothetical protein